MSEFLRALRRQWVALLIGLVLTGSLAAGAYLLSKPTYEIKGHILLLPPPTAVGEGGNPYLALGGLRQAVDLLGVALTDQATREEVESISGDVDYSVQADAWTTSPILVIEVRDSSAEGATTIRDLLMARVPVRLEAIQQTASVNAENAVTSTVLTMDAEAEEVGRDRLRSAIIAAVIGLALTLLVVARIDARARPDALRVRRSALPKHPNADDPSPVNAEHVGADDTSPVNAEHVGADDTSPVNAEHAGADDPGSPSSSTREPGTVRQG